MPVAPSLNVAPGSEVKEVKPSAGSWKSIPITERVPVTSKCGWALATLVKVAVSATALLEGAVPPAQLQSVVPLVCPQRGATASNPGAEETPEVSIRALLQGGDKQ